MPGRAGCDIIEAKNEKGEDFVTEQENRRRVDEVLKESLAPTGIPAYGICRLENLNYIPSRKQRFLPERGSVIVFLLPYYAGDFPGRNISLYSVGNDYHPIAASLLEKPQSDLMEEFPEQRFLFFSDAGPIPEVEAACRAGLGVRGMHRQLIHPVYGSLFFLAEIVTDLMLTPDAPLIPDHCERCGLCLKACPTGALSPGGLDQTLCRSAVTQKKRDLTEWDKEQIEAGGFVWGCDRCSLACPHNKNLPLTPIRAFREHLDPCLTAENLEDLAARKSYGWRGKKVLRRNLALIEGRGWEEE